MVALMSSGTISPLSSDKGKVEPDARFEDKKRKEANDNIRGQNDHDVTSCRNHHGGHADLLNGHESRQVRENAAAEHAHDHEARKDVTKRRRWLTLFHQAWSPIEHKDEHRGFERTGDQSTEQDLPVVRDDLQRTCNVGSSCTSVLAEILRPGADNEEHANKEKAICKIKGGYVPSVMEGATNFSERLHVCSNFAQLASQNSGNAAAEIGK